MDTNRRDFLKNASLAGACVCIGGLAILESCSSGKFVASTREGSTMVVLESALGDAAFVSFKDDKEGPVLLYRTGAGFGAVSMKCTHRNCDTRAKDNLLKCPCHGSEFKFDGTVIKGPAKEPLKTWRVEQKDGKFLIS